MGLATASINDSPELFSLELSRSVKENHGKRILKISTPISDSFSNLVAVLSFKQVNIYDTDNIGQGHMDLLSHYSIDKSEDEFLDCCWLKSGNEDGYLAILMKSGDIELLSLSYSAIISNINLPKSIKIVKIFADPVNNEQFFGIDDNSDNLYIFSFDASVDSPLIDSQILAKSTIFPCANGQLLEITEDRLKMRPLLEVESDENLLIEISQSGRIEFASSIVENNETVDYFIIDQMGRVFFLHSPTTSVKIPSSVWSKRARVTHDGSNLILILCKDGNLALFHLDKNDFSFYKGALKTSSRASEAFCQFIAPADCCSQGRVRRVLIGDDCGLLNIYRIVK